METHLNLWRKTITKNGKTKQSMGNPKIPNAAHAVLGAAGPEWFRRWYQRSSSEALTKREWQSVYCIYGMFFFFVEFSIFKKLVFRLSIFFDCLFKDVSFDATFSPLWCFPALGWTLLRPLVFCSLWRIHMEFLIVGRWFPARRYQPDFYVAGPLEHILGWCFLTSREPSMTKTHTHKTSLKTHETSKTKTHTHTKLWKNNNKHVLLSITHLRLWGKSCCLVGALGCSSGLGWGIDATERIKCSGRKRLALRVQKKMSGLGVRIWFLVGDFFGRQKWVRRI